MTEAVSTLRRNLTCGKVEAENRAAIAIIDLGIKARELGELRDRVGLLEGMLKAREEADAFHATNAENGEDV